MIESLGQVRNPRVLIVEDDPGSTELLQTIFVKFGYEVIGNAADGREGFEKYKELRPDFITLDIVLPFVDGRMCAKEILDFDPQANILVISVLDGDELGALRSLGIKNFIRKPIDILGLSEHLMNMNVAADNDGKKPMEKEGDGEPASSALLFDILHHDIVNPLGIIKNFSDLISDDAPKAMKPQLDAIIRNADRLIELVEDARMLSELSKLNSLDYEKLEITGLIEESITDIAGTIREKEVQIKFDSSGETFTQANPLIGTVFSNLLSNAVKYSPKGGEVSVEISEGDGCVVIAFKDRGPGVEEAYKRSIFERVERAKKEGVKGTGLGLAVAKRIVELHCGRIWVEDNPGGGSVFIVEIPNDLN